MGDAVVLKRGGSPGSGVIHVWKEYNVNTSTKYVWDKWSLNSTTTYKWEKWDTVRSQEKILCYSSYTEDGTGYHGVSIGTTLYKAMMYDGSTFTGLDPVPATGPFGQTYLYHFQTTTVGGQTYENAPMCDLDIVNNGAITDGFIYFRDLSIYASTQLSSAFRPFNMTSNIPAKGTTSYGQVTSTNSSAYPSNGVSGSYWYVSAGSDTSYSKGSTSYGQVESTSSTAYPNPGNHTDGYWYENRQEVPVYSMGTFKQNVYSTNPNMYPQNGRLGDYWYVYDGTIS